jgi:hypothetical protein
MAPRLLGWHLSFATNVTLVVATFSTKVNHERHRELLRDDGTYGRDAKEFLKDSRNRVMSHNDVGVLSLSI